MSETGDVKAVVRAKYGQAALRVQAGQGGCCGTAPGAMDCCDPITSNLYDAAQAGEVPDAALKASLGCGNPTALAELKPGEIVLDLGSGGGIDVLLSAKRVGPAGKAYGLDMTDEMLALAQENRRRSGLTNVEFLKGEIEHIPLPDNAVDVIISNCVINLSGDKDRVLREAFRVLKPGGRFAVSDVVIRGEVPPAIRKSMELWVGCIAGALSEVDYRGKLAAAGFVRHRRRSDTRVRHRRCAHVSRSRGTGRGCHRAGDGRQVRQRLRARGEALATGPGRCRRAPTARLAGPGFCAPSTGRPPAHCSQDRQAGPAWLARDALRHDAVRCIERESGFRYADDRQRVRTPRPGRVEARASLRVGG